MSEFVNTLDRFSDEAVVAKLMQGTLDEFCDNVITTIASDVFRDLGTLVTLRAPNVKKVKKEAFYDSSNLVNVELNSATGPVDSSAYGMFFRCESIKSISLPSWNDYVGQSMFYQCTSLTRCNMPLAVGTYSGAFEGCSALMELSFPGMISISGKSFENCTKLCALILPNANTKANLDSTFEGRNSLFAISGYVYVPQSLLNDYKSATNWSAIAGRIKAIENYNALNKWDEDYTNAGYSVVYPKAVFTTGSASGGFSLTSSITFQDGKTYKVLYDHNEYDIVATSEGLAHVAEDETTFTIAQPVGSANNVASTRAELFSSVVGIYTR